MNAKHLLRADWVAAMDRPLLRDGAVAHAAGIILDVGPFEAMRQKHADAAVEELGRVVLLPGLINAHVHLELSGIARPDARWNRSFVDWLLAVMTQPIGAAAGAREGIAHCRRFGVCAVGDISRQCAITRPILAAAGLAGVSYGEITGMGQRRTGLGERLEAAANLKWQSERLRIGVSPHAPYSVEPGGYRVAMETGLPLATHLAETPEEAEFLADHTGPFRRLWETIGGWDEAIPRSGGGPIRMAAELGLLNRPTLLAHVNAVDDGELALLSRGRASVVYCPRTHAYFQRPPHRWREMLERGINVAVGTDSCASSGDLNLVDDLRLMHREGSHVPPEVLWQMATLRGARALGMEDRLGSLTAGKWAEFVAFQITSDDPLREILETKTLPVSRRDTHV